MKAKAVNKMYLKIRNPGVCDPDLYKLLGATTKDKNDNFIGQFGSGSKHAVSVCLRHGLSPIVCAGDERMEFSVLEQKIDGKPFNRILINNTEKLGFVLEYGKMDWSEVGLALREFVSNALDETNNDWSKCELSICNDKEIITEKGFTNIYVPMNSEVMHFFENIGKWFLHFSEPESLTLTVLSKDDTTRNLNPDEKNQAVIYRRGVRVREVVTFKEVALFDYNIHDLKLDEARIADNELVRKDAAIALANSSVEVLTKFFLSFIEDGKKFWEHSFTAYNLKNNGDWTPNKKIQANWALAFERAFGKNTVISTSEREGIAKSKGYQVVIAPAEIVNACTFYKLKTPNTVLSEDEREGRTLAPPTQDCQLVFNNIWTRIVALGMNNQRSKPKLKLFSKPMDGDRIIMGFYRDDTVHINSDIADGNSVMLKATIIEEIAHHVTGAYDGSRDLQDWSFTLATRMM